MDKVESPLALGESLDRLWDLLIDAQDLIAECRAYLRHKDPTHRKGVAFLVRPDHPPEVVDLDILSRYERDRKGEHNGLRGAKAAE